MEEPRRTRVLIAGGSITGLALANMLQHINVDYLVLEKYRDIAPNVGASIAVFPNGARLLDQLGCYGALEELMRGVTSFGTLNMRNSEGKVIKATPDAAGLFEKHFGYPPQFIDRQMLLQILYDRVKDKDRILLEEGVVSVSQSAHGVQVVTQRGNKYAGEILVGADGLHSLVRREMWRLADAQAPRHFSPKDRQNLSYGCNCIFGISKPIASFPKSSSFQRFGHHYSYLMASGPGERIYWFLFQRLPKTTKIASDQVPRFTNEDRDRLAAKHASDPITEDLTFKDIYDNRTSATLIALPEKVYSKWHYGRIITIGDASHKFNPIGGQGGSQAMESAAALTNELARVLDQKPGGPDGALTEPEVARIFKNTQSTRLSKAQGMMNMGWIMSKALALDNAFIRLMVRYILPLMPNDQIISKLGGASKNVVRLEMLDVPVRPHEDLYDDERPAKPWFDPAPLLPISAAIFLFLLAKSTGYIRPPLLNGYWEGRPFMGLPQQTKFIGIPPFDFKFSMAAAMFADSISWNDVGHSLQFAYLLYLLFPCFILWYIESYRPNNKPTLLSKPIVFGVLMGFSGIGIIQPLWNLVLVLATAGAPCDGATKRHVPSSAAKALVPAALVAYLLPTVLMFLPTYPRESLQNLIAVWQIAPIALSMLLPALVTWFERSNPEASKPVAAHMANSDLMTAYKRTFWLSAVLHIATVATCLISGSPSLSLLRLLVPSINTVPDVTEPEPALAHVFTFLKWDFAFAAVALFLLGLYSVVHLRCFGLVRNKTALAMAAQFVLAQALVGPAAAIVWQWWRREEVLAKGGLLGVAEDKSRVPVDKSEGVCQA